jgi:hypothetical protein
MKSDTDSQNKKVEMESWNFMFEFLKHLTTLNTGCIVLLSTATTFIITNNIKIGGGAPLFLGITLTLFLLSILIAGFDLVGISIQMAGTGKILNSGFIGILALLSGSLFITGIMLLIIATVTISFSTVRSIP